MGYLNTKNEEVRFLDMDGQEIKLGMNIYQPGVEQVLRVAWFQPDYPELGDVLMCQQVENLNAFSPLPVESCAKRWRIKEVE